MISLTDQGGHLHGTKLIVVNNHPRYSNESKLRTREALCHTVRKRDCTRYLEHGAQEYRSPPLCSTCRRAQNQRMSASLASSGPSYVFLSVPELRSLIVLPNPLQSLSCLLCIWGWFKEVMLTTREEAKKLFLV